MPHTETEHPRWDNAHRHFFSHLAHMPGWHKAVILLAGLIAAAGTVGQIMAKVSGSRDAEVQRRDANTTAAPAGSKGFVANTAGPAATPPSATAPDVGPLGHISPHAIKVGLSIVLGFIIGWLFRAFLKTMALLALLAAAATWALAHFGLIHLGSSELNTARERATGAATWLEAHAGQIKDLALSHLPSTGGGAFGAFLGFRRR